MPGYRQECGPLADHVPLSSCFSLSWKGWKLDHLQMIRFQRYKRPRFNWKEAKKDAQPEICSLKLDNFWILDTAGNYMTTG